MIKDPEILPDEVDFAALESYSYCLVEYFETLLRAHSEISRRLSGADCIYVSSFAETLLPQDLMDLAIKIAHNWSEEIIKRYARKPVSLPFMFQNQIQELVIKALGQARDRIIIVKAYRPVFRETVEGVVIEV